MSARWVLLLVLGACATHQSAVVPALLNPRLTPTDVADRSVVTGHVISLGYDPRAGYPRIVVANNANGGRGWRVLVLRHTRTGMTMAVGDSVTAWCRGAAGDLIADSVRVDLHVAPKRPEAPPPYQPPAMPPLRLATWQAPIVRRYWRVSVDSLATGRVSHTHVRVSGLVTLVRRETDGDVHLKLVGRVGFIVGECIPVLPCAFVPKEGERVTLEGISRRDAEHGWYEVHPIERIIRVPS